MNNISIVTMFFDIGRGDWSSKTGIADFSNRDNDKYFTYFSHLAKLQNDMVIFTTENFQDRILNLREGRPTKIVIIDLEKEYKKYIHQISHIQNNKDFIQKLPEKLRSHPEYRSPQYVLINNLKTHFVCHAIKQNLTLHEQVAWIDFGYCREPSTLGEITQWNYVFDPNHMHFFTIKRSTYFGIIKNPRFARTINDAYHAIFNNKVYIIGSVFIGNKQKWQEFAEELYSTQK